MLIPAKIWVRLFQEAKVADDRNFDRFALADTEEHDDLKNKDDDVADTGEDPAKNRDDAAEDQEDLNHRDLQSLADMEGSKLGFLSTEESDDDSDRAKQIRSHCIDFVIRNVFLIELSGMILRIDCRIGDRSRVGLLLILLVGLLLILLELLILLTLIGIKSGSNTHRSTTLRAVRYTVSYISTTLRTKCHR